MFTETTLAYIDPVSGTIIVQMLIAGCVGVVGFFRRSIWAVCRRFLGRKDTKTGNGS